MLDSDTGVRLLRIGFMSGMLGLCIFTAGALTGWWFATRYRLEKRQEQHSTGGDRD